MTAVAMIVLAGGLGQVVAASLTVLADIAMGIGALFMLSVALFTVTYLLARLDERKHPLTVVGAPMLTEIGDELPDILGQQPPEAGSFRLYALNDARRRHAAGSFRDD